MILETERLILQPHTEANFAKIHLWQNDPELLHLNADSIVLQTEQQTRDALKRWMDPSSSGIIHFAIHRRQEHDLIGFAQIAAIDAEHARCKLALVIGEKSLWGRGFGREALRRLVTYCFDDLGMNRIGAEIFEINERSIRLFVGAGFRLEGVIRENVRKSGRFIDEHMYGLLRGEWAP